MPAHRARAFLVTADRADALAAILTCEARCGKVYWTVKHKTDALECDGHWPSQFTFVSYVLNRRFHKAAYLSVFSYLRRSNSEIMRKISGVVVVLKLSKFT